MRAFCATLAAGAAFCSSLGLRAELANGIQAVVHDSVVTSQDVETYTLPLVQDLLPDMKWLAFQVDFGSGHSKELH